MVPLNESGKRCNLKGNYRMTIALFSPRNPEAVQIKEDRHSWVSQGTLVACPLIFSLFVGIYSRSQSDRFVVPTSTSQQEARTLAYAPYLQEQKKLFAKSNYQIDRQQLLKVAKDWERGIDDGTLQPLAKVSFEDSLQQGVRYQILRGNSMIVSALFDDAQRLMLEDHANMAADETLLGVKLAESVKYSDLNTVFLGAEEERVASGLLASNWSALDKSHKAAVHATFGKVVADFSNLDGLTHRSRKQYYDWLMRTGDGTLSIEDVRRTAMVTNQIAANPTGRKAFALMRSGVVDGAGEDDCPEFLSELRMAWHAERTNQQESKSLLVMS